MVVADGHKGGGWLKRAAPLNEIELPAPVCGGRVRVSLVVESDVVMDPASRKGGNSPDDFTHNAPSLAASPALRRTRLRRNAPRRCPEAGQSAAEPK